jgi:hypothetical protein
MRLRWVGASASAMPAWVIHPGHDLGHRIGRNVIGGDAGLNTAQQQLAQRL